MVVPFPCYRGIGVYKKKKEKVLFYTKKGENGKLMKNIKNILDSKTYLSSMNFKWSINVFKP